MAAPKTPRGWVILGLAAAAWIAALIAGLAIYVAITGHL